jgi:hypothetical protein
MKIKQKRCIFGMHGRRISGWEVQTMYLLVSAESVKVFLETAPQDSRTTEEGSKLIPFSVF